MVRDVLAEFIIGPAFGRTRWLALLTMRAAVVSQALRTRAEICSMRFFKLARPRRHDAGA
jgi:hypothetical protein